MSTKTCLHPGHVLLRNFLEPLGISQTELTEHLKIRLFVLDQNKDRADIIREQINVRVMATQ